MFFLVASAQLIKELQIVTPADNSLRPDQGELTFKKKKSRTVGESNVWHTASLSILEKVLEQCVVATIQQ